MLKTLDFKIISVIFVSIILKFEKPKKEKNPFSFMTCFGLNRTRI